MRAIQHIEKMLADVEGAELSSREGGRADPAFVDFVALPFKSMLRWMLDNGFSLVPTSAAREVRFVDKERTALAVAYNAFGGATATGLPLGFPQEMKTIVQVGFIDLTSPSWKASLGRRTRKNPQSRYHEIGTFSEWMRQVNGIVLREAGIGTWELVRQPYKEWFVEGMRPSTAANIVIDGISTGQINRKRRR